MKITEGLRENKLLISEKKNIYMTALYKDSGNCFWVCQFAGVNYVTVIKQHSWIN